MTPDMLIAELRNMQAYFERSIRCLTEKDSAFTPVVGTRTVAQQVAHTAQSIDWFFEGAFRPEGFNMDFAKLEEDVTQTRSLSAARDWLAAAFAGAIEKLRSSSAEELAQPLAEGIMGGQPRYTILSALNDHTAHHRGALTVYARLLGHVPPMPYMEMPPEAPA